MSLIINQPQYLSILQDIGHPIGSNYGSRRNATTKLEELKYQHGINGAKDKDYAMCIWYDSFCHKMKKGA
jgi:hypothetical protein